MAIVDSDGGGGSANIEDTFNVKRHTIKLNIAPGTALHGEAEKAVGVPSTDSYIASVADNVNDAVGIVTAGSTMRLVGGKFKDTLIK